MGGLGEMAKTHFPQLPCTSGEQANSTKLNQTLSLAAQLDDCPKGTGLSLDKTALV